jgi:hypothetical protein
MKARHKGQHHASGFADVHCFMHCCAMWLQDLAVMFANEYELFDIVPLLAAIAPSC